MDSEIIKRLEERLEVLERENAALRNRVDSLESDVRMIGDVNSFKRRVASVEHDIEMLYKCKMDDHARYRLYDR